MAEAETAANDVDERPIIDRDFWLACAVPLSRLPALGSEVYYFPHGHAEQCPAHLPAPLPAPHLFPCTVTAIRLAADAETSEVFAEISLKPGPHRGPLAAAAAPAADQQVVTPYFAKELTTSDANNGGGFTIPRYCADHVFPNLNFDAEPAVQDLLMRDPDGRRWKFRHIYRGTPRRHLLTTGWSKFVNDKLLVTGDFVVFVRRPDGELLIGLRLSPRYPIVARAPDQPPPCNARARVPPEEVMEAARLAAEGTPFTVTYYPRHGAGEFVVPRKDVEDALAAPWETGTQVRMQVMAAGDVRRIDWANGTVKAIHHNIWRALEIDWDKSSPSSASMSTFVNAWQVQFVACPPLSKRPRILDAITPMSSRDGYLLPAPPIGTESSAMASILLGSLFPAGMQGARHVEQTVVAASASPTAALTAQLLFPMPTRELQMPPLISPSGVSSEILDPRAASPPSHSVNIPPPEVPVEVKSIRLFGTTITVHVAPDVVSKEVNNGDPNGVAHENANRDV